MSQASRRRPRPEAHDPYGVLSRTGVVAPAIALIGLVLVAFVSVQFWFNPIPIGISSARTLAPGQTAIPVDRTPLPSNKVQVNPKSTLAGTIVYAKAGNLWIQHGTEAHQLTTSGHASNPVWSPDGQWIYYLETRYAVGYWPPQAPSYYTLNYPVLVRIKPDGSGAQDVLSSLITSGSRYKYFYWIRQPSISPDGRTMAVISDGPNPDGQDTVVQFIDLASGKLTNPRIKEAEAPLGHTDPAWKPDGTALAFVMETREAAKGTPSIWIYNTIKRTATELTDPGYRNPSWSPDGRYLAAVKDAGGKEDVVILDASTGKQVAQVTKDGDSWLPVWSPAGDAIAYLHLSGVIVDLEMVHVAQDATGAWVVKPSENLTEYSGLEETSRAAWYIAPSEMPSPTPAPSALPSGASPSASGS